jgi:hypothetical protein
MNVLLSVLGWIAGFGMCMLAISKIGTDQFPLYIISAFVCYIFAVLVAKCK